MKRHLQFILSISAASALAFSALAQDTPRPNTERPDYTLDRAPIAQRVNRLNGAAKASDVSGMAVRNYQDERLGKVEYIAVDVESGRIVEVILSVGGFLGLGDNLIAVPSQSFHCDAVNKVLQLDASKDKLKAAPRFDSSKWDECTQSNRLTEVYGYYGEQPYFVPILEGSPTVSSDGVPPNSLPRNMDGTINTDGGRAVDKVRKVEIASQVVATNEIVSTRNPDGTWTREYYPSATGANSASCRLGYVEKSSKLIGILVKNLQDEKLGKVENILLDLPSGRIVAVIVSSGGFLGMVGELSAVPPTALRFARDRDALQLDASKEMLSSAPHFKANQWPDFAQPAYVGGVYHAYRVEPYFTTDAASQPDNTVRNVRSRDDRSLTPFDQGNSKADLNTTAQIRKEIIAGKDMSLNAKNVKIITLDGRVTLRGPVNTPDEKRIIGEIADRIANSANVDNQLDVKLVTSNGNNN